jgi:two-component sensor histidine kinase
MGPETSMPIQLERLRTQRAALADFGLFAFRCNDLDQLLHRAAEMVSETLDVQLVKVLEHLPARGEMLIRSGVNWQPGVVGHETFGDDERSPGGYALRSEQPVVSPDLAEEDRFEIPDVLRRHGVRSMINVIIAGEDRAFGVLEVDDTERRPFGEDEIAFLRNYANLLAAAIERFRTHDELEHAAREQSVLANELGHRVRNLLGLIRALASQTTAQGRSGEEFRTAFIERLHALSVAEGLVFERQEELADANMLAREVLAPYRQIDDDRIGIAGPPVDLAPRQARMLGIALHELATNAAKYGALSVEHGAVCLEWEVEEVNGDRLLALTWKETDGPPIAPPERRGFGSKLLEDVVAHELGGGAELVFGETGLVYRLIFPVVRK